jgi:hypothetical protein
VLPKQNVQKPVRRDEAYELALVVHHREGAFLMLNRLPGGNFLLCVRGDHGGIRIHDLANYGLLRCGEELLYGKDTNQPCIFQDGHVRQVIVGVLGELIPDLSRR